MNQPAYPNRFHNAHYLFCQYEEVLHRFMNSLNLEAIPNVVNNFPHLSRFSRDAIIFQAHIMFMDYNAVRNFITNYYNLYGSMATYLFINSPIYDFKSGIAFTPLVCACLWTNNTDIVRLLYSYGADVNLHNLDGRYPDQHYNIPYFNHLSDYICYDNVEDPRVAGHQRPVFRNMNDFIHVRDEIELLAGVRNPNNNWHRPEIVISIDNIVNIH